MNQVVWTCYCSTQNEADAAFCDNCTLARVAAESLVNLRGQMPDVNELVTRVNQLEEAEKTHTDSFERVKVVILALAQELGYEIGLNPDAPSGVELRRIRRQQVMDELPPKTPSTSGQQTGELPQPLRSNDNACPSCSAQNLARAKFCGRCGKDL